MLNRALTVLCVLALAVALPARSASAQCSGGSVDMTLTDSTGYLWDIMQSGAISNGTGDSYDEGFVLNVDGMYFPTMSSSTTELMGRQLVHGPATMSGLNVTRRAYVPTTEGWARFLDVFENPTGASITAVVRLESNCGSDGSTMVTGSSSSDTSFSTADRWVTTDDSDGGGDPSLSFNFWGAGGASMPGSVGMTVFSCASIEGPFVQYSITVPAGGRVALLAFGTQNMNRAASIMNAGAIDMLPEPTLVGLDDYLADIANWSLAVAGAPQVRFTSASTMDEGSELVVTIEVTDPEGDTATWDWDLDGDGTYGEMPGATSITIAAGTTDGPGDRRVGVHATDGTNMADRIRSITVNNVVPMITSDPPATATSVGAMYRYQLEVLDPAGDLDPLMYTIMRGPTGMVISTTGLLTWTPDDGDVTLPGEPIDITVEVNDGDMGVVTQEWQMTVSPNRAPSSPMLIYPVDNSGVLTVRPRLVVANASDPDLDTLTYLFEIDRVDTFDSTDKISSGAVTETPGYSFWYVTSDLTPGRWYWRAWVSDGTVETPPRAQAFIMVPPSVPTDGGVVEYDSGGARDGGAMPAPPDDGCGCVAAGAARNGTGRVPGGAIFAGVGILALGLVARRRRHR